MKTRLRTIKCYVWPTLFYAAETWTIANSLLFRLDGFEMWSIENIMDGNDYQRRSICEKDGTRQRNCVTIQYEEITI